MVRPVPEPSSRIVKGFGAYSASRSEYGVGSGELGRACSLGLRFESLRSDAGGVDKDLERCRREGKGLGGSNSIPGAWGSKYAMRAYAASLSLPISFI